MRESKFLLSVFLNWHHFHFRGKLWQSRAVSFFYHCLRYFTRITIIRESVNQPEIKLFTKYPVKIYIFKVRNPGCCKRKRPCLLASAWRWLRQVWTKQFFLPNSYFSHRRTKHRQLLCAASPLVARIQFSNGFVLNQPHRWHPKGRVIRVKVTDLPWHISIAIVSLFVRFIFK